MVINQVSKLLFFYLNILIDCESEIRFTGIDHNSYIETVESLRPMYLNFIPNITIALNI